MQLERSKNAKRNIVFGVLNKIVNIVLPFCLRTVLIRVLGAEYLGLNGLFSSILQVLNISELGFSNAVVYSMYKPIAEGDNKTIYALLKFYKVIYFIIGSFITVSGLIIMPFIPKFIKGDVPSDINIFILYFLFLLNTVLSYFVFAYRNSLLLANQRTDLISKINTVVHLICYSTQFVFLYLTKNFYIYVILLLLSTIITNLFTYKASVKLYPDIHCEGKLEKSLQKSILTSVKGLFLNKVCAISRNSLDSIFVSAFLGLSITAVYNNYYYIMSAVVGIIGVISPSILAGIGNSVVLESKEKNFEDMKKINFLYMWISGFCTICLLCLYQPFTEIFFGIDMLFPFKIVLTFCIYFYVLQMGDIRCLYSDANGLWWENRFRAVIETLLNIILNYLLGKYLGVIGIVLGTLISLFFINFLWGSNILFSKFFTNSSILSYYWDNFRYALVTFCAAIVTYFLCSLVHFNLYIVLFLRLFICIIIPNFIYFIVYKNTSIFKLSINWLIGVIRNH